MTEAQPSNSNQSPAEEELEVLGQIVITRVRDKAGDIMVMTGFSDDLSVPEAVQMIGMAQLELFQIASDGSITLGDDDVDPVTPGGS